METEKVRMRVNQALAACNKKTIQVKQGLQNVQVEIELSRYRFEKTTHFNQKAKAELDSNIEKFANNEIIEDVIKESIKQFRDASDTAILDNSMYVLEPSQSDYERMDLFFDLKDFKLDVQKRVVPLRDEKQEILILLEKMFNVVKEYREMHKYQKKGVLVLSSYSLFVVQKQFQTFVKYALKQNVKPEKRMKDLYDLCVNTDFNEEYVLLKELKTLDDLDVLIIRDEEPVQKALFTTEPKNIVVTTEIEPLPDKDELAEIFLELDKNNVDQFGGVSEYENTEHTEKMIQIGIENAVAEHKHYCEKCDSFWTCQEQHETEIKYFDCAGCSPMPEAVKKIDNTRAINLVAEEKMIENITIPQELAPIPKVNKYLEDFKVFASKVIVNGKFIQGAISNLKAKLEKASSSKDAETIQEVLDYIDATYPDVIAVKTVEVSQKAVADTVIKENVPQVKPQAETSQLMTTSKYYEGSRIEVKFVDAEETELTEDEKNLQSEDSGEEDLYGLENQIVQGDLFGDISAPTVKREKMFSNEQIIEAAFNYHRQQGFPYREISPAMAMFELQQLAEQEDKTLINSKYGYQIADNYHKHRFHASANGMFSPFASFNDDKKLRKAIKLELLKSKKPRVWAGGMMTLVNGTQACSNFRPGFAAHLYRKYCPKNAVVLDTSTGYGGRLLGAVASQMVARYIGIDPNVPTFQANIKMIEELELRQLLEFELYNLPAEDVDIELLRERCDFSFTSPPYFAKELYSQDDTQSWKRYPTGEQWRDGFLKKMLELTYAALKPDTHAIVNIADVKVKNKIYPLSEWTKQLGEEVGFKYELTDNFPMMARFGKGMSDEVAVEPVIIFKKEK